MSAPSPVPARVRRFSIALVGLAAAATTAAPPVALAAPDQVASSASPSGSPQPLDLGPAGLPESRRTTTLQPGVTLTRIDRGEADPSLFWTNEIAIPATTTSPDPDAPPRSLSDHDSAQAEADRLQSEGFTARVEAVRQPETADVPAGTLGYRVRVGNYPNQAAADAGKERLARAGETASSVYTGWDGDSSDRGPWHVDVLRIDPKTFTGRLDGSFGPDLYRRETTSQLAQAAGATAGVNAGFFVLDPASGAPGDPAGAGVYDGRVLSESTNGRPALVLHDNARGSAVRRLTWAGVATIGGRATRLDGIDRVPGLVRNCGGDATDSPTDLPLHDLTCTDGSELVAFTPDYGQGTPSGDGREVVLEHGVVTAVHESRGTTLAPGQTSLQATGDDTALLDGVQVGDEIPVRARLEAGGSPLATPRGTTVSNGGPQLVRDGRVDITQRRDGFVHPGDPSFAYGWFVKRNPRTLAGVDAQGRTVLVTVDGRSTQDLGLSIPEAADVARSLGVVDAINLDGGGSTTMVADGQVINHPSDATGERPVGDALLIQP
ncbi:phosphodiester glycosidase family protein [Nocardioides ungokensis]|uniref:phosphodiester glycosidase family protein n=1 Tax=Nocardioides ungokensis TaxID=1643322 RepID=UPI0015DECDD6|nr:phosphodiester glycosidase family protein [Nocardioides ungokensis]